MSMRVLQAIEFVLYLPISRRVDAKFNNIEPFKSQSVDDLYVYICNMFDFFDLGNKNDRAQLLRQPYGCIGKCDNYSQFFSFALWVRYIVPPTKQRADWMWVFSQ